MTTYRIKMDAGEGEPIQSGHFGDSEHLNEAVRLFLLEEESLLNKKKGRSSQWEGGHAAAQKLIVYEMSKVKYNIPPGTLVNGEFVQDGYIVQKSFRVVARLWIEADDPRDRK